MMKIMKRMKRNIKKFERLFSMKTVMMKRNQVRAHQAVIKKMMLMKKNKKLLEKKVSKIHNRSIAKFIYLLTCIYI